jgi:hypothetical protein
MFECWCSFTDSLNKRLANIVGSTSRNSKENLSLTWAHRQTILKKLCKQGVIDDNIQIEILDSEETSDDTGTDADLAVDYWLNCGYRYDFEVNKL